MRWSVAPQLACSLLYRSGYIPRVIGVLLVYDGLGWVIVSLQPYLYRNVHLGFFFKTSSWSWFSRLWLLVRGWKIQEPIQHG